MSKIKIKTIEFIKLRFYKISIKLNKTKMKCIIFCSVFFFKVKSIQGYDHGFNIAFFN